MSRQSVTLHEQVNQWEIVLEWMEEHEEQIIAAGGEPPPELIELMEQIEGDINEKIGRVALVIRNLEASANAAAEEAARLQALAKSRAGQAKSLKGGYLLWQLRRLGAKKVETPLANVRRQVNGTPTLTVIDEKAAAAWMVQDPPPPPPPLRFDFKAALADLKEAREYPKGPTEEPVIISGVRIDLGEHVRIS